MADPAVGKATSQENNLDDLDPGASNTGMIVAVDSYEDLSYDINGHFSSDVRQRLPSGNISEIVRQGSDSNEDIVNVIRVSETSKVEDASSEVKEQVEKELNSGIGSLTVTEDGAFEDSPGVTPTSTTPTPPPVEVVSETVDEDLEYVHSDRWRQQKKHVFILSEAGKPIYSRYGNEDKLVTIFGVMQALVSFVMDKKDVLRCIVAGHHRFVFLVREHLILVAVSRTHESMQQLLLQLTYVYNQVLSVLTYSQLSRIFKQRRNYDLRRLLTGAEKFFDNLLNLIDCDPSLLLGAVRCLPLSSQVRDTIAQSIVQHAKVKDLVFAILVANNQLITLVRMKKYFLHPIDLHLIFNLVSASESFKAAESWTPVCLPKFDSGGYLHAHISYLDEGCHTCLLLLTVERDIFFTLSDCKQKILERLLRHHCLQAIHESLATKNYSISKVGIQDLRHFMYKSKSTAQYTSPELEAPYNTEEEQERLFQLYRYLHHRLHNTARPLKILFHVGPSEALLGWVTSGFELYAVFSPLVTKPVAINSINKLLKWIKKEEDRLFILNTLTF